MSIERKDGKSFCLETMAALEVCTEFSELPMKAIAQALNFGKSVSDNGWGRSRACCTKSLRSGVEQLGKIDRFFPSGKMCSACGTVKTVLGLSEREYVCETYGHTTNRDINAAVNILKEGLRLCVRPVTYRTEGH